MSVARQELQDLSDEAWQRTSARLQGLTDEEYFWEPAPGCWSIRQRPDGSWRWDTATPGPDVEPFTTIAWRIWHLTDMYGEDRAPQWLDVPPQGDPIGLDDPNGGPAATAAAALDLLRRAHGRWDAHLALATDELLAQPIGDVGGEYGDNSRAGYVLHMLDEFVHHGAEIALLRDLWRWNQPVHADSLIDRAARGDLSVAAETSLDGSPQADEVLDTAARYARWELVAALVRNGVGPDVGTTTPLHRAAIAGERDVVETLVGLGARLDVCDPNFGATPAGWARYGGHDDIAALLEAPDRS